MSKPRSRNSVRNNRRGRDQWQRLMAAFEASELTQRAFCAEQGLAYSTFCYWRRRLRQEAGHADHTPALVELPVLTGSESGHWRVELDMGDGLVLRLR